MSRPCIVLVIGPSPALLGGISSLARTLVQRLAREQHIRVRFVPMDPMLPRLLHRLERIRYVRTFVRLVMFCAVLPAHVRRCDVVHVYSASYVAFLLTATPAILISRLLGKPTILNYHSGDAEAHLRRWPSAVRTMKLADEIVVSSEFLAQVFARFGLSARVLPSPVELNGFTFRRRSPLTPRFFTSRLLEPIYNVPCVLRAFRKVQERYPEAQLTIAGVGGERAKLERLARESGARNVQFVGRVPAEQMPEYCDRADFYLSGTDVDNLPSSVLEAMAAGMLVVTTDAGGIPFMLAHERDCLMVPCGDHDQMAAEALRLLANPELAAEIAHRARLHCTNYEWHAVRAGWLTMYQQLAASYGRDTARRPRPRRTKAGQTTR